MSEPNGHFERAVDETDWSPERKVVGAAVAVVLLGLVQVFTAIDIPLGVEGGIAVIIAYFLPNKRKAG